MEISNHQTTSLVAIISLFVVATLCINFFMENPLSYFFVLSIGTTYALFRIFSGERVKSIVIASNKISVRKYSRPFWLIEESYDLKEVIFRKRRVLVGEGTMATKVYAENTRGQLLFLLSKELLLWKDEEIKRILCFLEEQKPSEI